MRREVVLDEPFMLCALAACGDSTGVKSLLQGGVAAGAADYDGRTALHVAAAHGQVSIVQMLLAAGAPVNPVDNFGRTPLHQAIELLQHDAAEVLRLYGGRLGRRARETAGAKAVVAEQRLTRYRAWFNGLHPDAKDVGRLPTDILLRWLWKHAGLRPAKLQHAAARSERPASLPLAKALHALAEYETGTGGYSHSPPHAHSLSAKQRRRANLSSSTIPWSRFSTMMVADLTGAGGKTTTSSATGGAADAGSVDGPGQFNPLVGAVQRSLALPRWQTLVATITRIFNEVKALPLSALYGNEAKLMSVKEGGGLAADDWSVEGSGGDSLGGVDDEAKIPAVSQRIGPLADADPEEFSVCLVSVDGQVLELGEWGTDFPMLELMSPILYAIAIDELGYEFVHSLVGHSASGVDTEYALDAHKRPLHALTTGGAMVISTLIDAHLPLSQRFGHMMNRMQELAGDMRVSFSQATYLAEQGSSYGTFALAHFIHEALPSPLTAAQAAYAAHQRRLAAQQQLQTDTRKAAERQEAAAASAAEDAAQLLSSAPGLSAPLPDRRLENADTGPGGGGGASALKSPTRPAGPRSSKDTMSPAVAAAQARARRLALSLDDEGGSGNAKASPGARRRPTVTATPRQAGGGTPSKSKPPSRGGTPSKPKADTAAGSSLPPGVGVGGGGGEAAAAARIKDLVDFFFQMSAIEVNTASVASFAATLAAGGRSPLSGRSVVSAGAAKACLQLMYTAGVQLAGEWSSSVGLPAKSAETGTIMIVLPNRLGLCVRAPALDANGLSARGLEFSRKITQAFPDWTLMSGSTGGGPGGGATGKGSGAPMEHCPHCYRSLRVESVQGSQTHSRRSSGDWTAEASEFSQGAFF